MSKKVFLKTTLCLAASLAVIGTAKAETLVCDNGIAGVSYILDKYYMLHDQSVLAKELEETTASTVTEEESEETVTTQSITRSVKETEESSEFDNIGISIAESYVRIRSEASTDSEVVGKLYQGCVAKILKVKGDWVKIESGNVKGYIMADYLAIGDDAEAVVDKYVDKVATVATETLKVREEKSVDSVCLTLIPEGETYDVVEEYKEWVKISIDDETGYVSKDYVNLHYDYQYAISIEEEQAKIAAEEAAKAAEEAQKAALLAQQQQAAGSSSNSSSSSSSSSSNSASSSSSSSSNSSSSNSTSSSTGSAKGSSIASYALNFVGNPYVYGGTSLTRGTDCSGFIQSVFAHFGYSLPRTSGGQSGYGKSVSVSNLQAGDVIYYTSNGRVNHVALYIGNGRVVHASNPRDGIKVSAYNYRTPAGARRIAG